MTRELTYQEAIGQIVERLRREKGWTQTQLAKKVKTSQSAIHRIENGRQNISFELTERLQKVLGGQILTVNDTVSQSYRIRGGRELKGEAVINTSKNAAVGLLCAALLNRGTTRLKHIARIEEVFRIIEVLESIGVKCRWSEDNRDLEIISPDELKLESIDVEAARKTRSILMFMGPLAHRLKRFKLPYAGGCTLGTRTIEPHLRALSAFGMKVDARNCSGFYDITMEHSRPVHGKLGKIRSTRHEYDEYRIDEVNAQFPSKRIVLIERGDTVTENVLMAAALYPGETMIVGASPNYMVQDLCFFLERLGVKIEGVGTTTLHVTGCREINMDVEYAPAEDPIEAMSFIAVALVTKSNLMIRRAPIEFLEVELETLKSMGANISRSPEYYSANGRTRLVDLKIHKSELVAPTDKIAPMPFPGLNIDNLPFFSVIAATAKGRTLIHDWVFENRAVYTTYLENLNARVELLDAHRVYAEGPTNWRPAELVAPPALRPAVVVLIAMLAADGTSILRNIYSINRGYQDFAERLNKLGADIQPINGL